MHIEVPAERSAPVVVGVDGSRSYQSVVDLAVAAAVRHRTSLLIVHVWPGRYVGALRPRGPIPTEEDGRHLLELAERRARYTAPGLEVGTRMEAGSIATALTEISGAARLLVVGHRDEAANRPSWGSTASYLAHHGGCPLLVYRGVLPVRGPVVLAASARAGGTATVASAFEEAELTESRLVAVHVWAPPAEPDTASPRKNPAADAAVRGEADHRLAETLAPWSGAHPGVAVERLLVRDVDLAYTIERASRRGRLLVAGIGRAGRLAEMLYNSPGSVLLSRTACPVLLVPPGWRLPRADQPAKKPMTAAPGGPAGRRARA